MIDEGSGFGDFFSTPSALDSYSVTLRLWCCYICQFAVVILFPLS